jgi:hypothetical protein
MAAIFVDTRMCVFSSADFQAKSVISYRCVYIQETHVLNLGRCTWCTDGRCSCVSPVHSDESWDHLTNLLTSTLVGFAAGRSAQIIQRSFLVNLKVPDEGCAEHFVLHCALSDTSWEWKGITGWNRMHCWEFPFKNSNSEVEKVCILNYWYYFVRTLSDL